MGLIMQGVKQHYSAVSEARDRYKPKEAGVSNGIFDSADCANPNREINAYDHLIIDCVIGWPSPAAQ